VGVDAETLAARLLEEAGVAVLAGAAFGAAGADHLRVSYATSPELLEEAFARMGALLAAL
jgi:aspartate/methionine/tyrosine aminotransferase